MKTKPFNNDIAGHMETPLSKNGGKDPSMSVDPAKQRWFSKGYCPYCGKNTPWAGVRSFVAPKNAPVTSPLETQTAWECAECGGRWAL